MVGPRFSHLDVPKMYETFSLCSVIIMRKMWSYPCVSFIMAVITRTLLTLQDLRDIAEGLGGAALADVCALKAEDYGGWNRGAPDLLLWRPASCASSGGVGGSTMKAATKAVEVKSRNDTLSDQQRAWLLVGPPWDWSSPVMLDSVEPKVACTSMVFQLFQPWSMLLSCFNPMPANSLINYCAATVWRCATRGYRWQCARLNSSIVSGTLFYSFVGSTCTSSSILLYRT